MLPNEDKSSTKSDQHSVRLVNFKMRKNSAFESTAYDTSTLLPKHALHKADQTNSNCTYNSIGDFKLNNECEKASISSEIHQLVPDKKVETCGLDDVIELTNRKIKAIRMFSSPSCSFETHEFLEQHYNVEAPIEAAKGASSEPNQQLVKPSRLDRLFNKPNLTRSKSLDVINLTREELLNELQFPIAQPSSYPNRLKLIKESINSRLKSKSKCRSQSLKRFNRREYGELNIFNKLKKIKQFKDNLIKYRLRMGENEEGESGVNENEFDDDVNQSFELSSEHAIHDLQGSSKYWIGKDYCNFIHKDVKEVHSPFKDSIDRTKVPRMPWHDVAGCVCGPAARDIARHFIQRWNYVKMKKVFQS